MAEQLSKEFRREGYAMDAALTFTSATESLQISQYDCVIGVTGPFDDLGIELCKHVRLVDEQCVVFLLCEGGDASMRIACLAAGADDVMSAPFAIEELKAKVRALLRRGPLCRAVSTTVAALVVDGERKEASIRGASLPLTTREFRLLEYLAQNANRVVSREELTERLWDDNHDPASHVIEVHVNRLRGKLRGRGAGVVIRTLRSLGYILEIGD